MYLKFYLILKGLIEGVNFDELRCSHNPMNQKGR
jgi:hypothetical protein